MNNTITINGTDYTAETIPAEIVAGVARILLDKYYDLPELPSFDERLFSLKPIDEQERNDIAIIVENVTDHITINL